MADRRIAAVLAWAASDHDPAADLHAAEQSYWSQHGEDGLLAALFDRLDVVPQVFVEIGASDGEENCTRALAEEGARGFWFEADRTRAGRAEKVAAELAVDVHCARVGSRNVTQLLAEAGVPADPDVLVVDIDGNDFWVLRRVLRSRSPRVVVVEYNSTFPPGVFWVRRNRRRAVWDETFRHGASLDAFVWLCGRFGYRLVACDSSGANAFFVREDEAQAAGLPEGDVADFYRPLLIAPPAIGHPLRICDDCPRLDANELDAIRVVEAVVVNRRSLDAVARRQLIGVRVVVENATARRLTSTGPTPVRLSAHLLDRSSEVVEFDGPRSWIHGGIAPHSSGWAAAVFEIDTAEVSTLRLCLVQESVGWAEAGCFDLDLTD
jgi:hypothetical protein